MQADAAAFDFPAEVDAILSTYALTQVPECAKVIARGAAALSPGGRWAVLDLKIPGRHARVAGAARNRDRAAFRRHR